MTMRTPWRSASRRDAGWNASPASRIRPRLASTRPQTIFDRVLLPAPFSPVRASTSPAWSDSVMSSSTVVA